MNKLKVLYNLTDITNEVENYLVDTYPLTLLAGDEINVGYYKPINSLFLELNTANTNTSNTKVYYYNGTSYVTTVISDETRGLIRSGFISWDRNLTNDSESIIGTETMYWYKIKVDADTSAMVLAGLNLVFSSDSDLTEEYPSIMEMLPEGKQSFIGFQVASRKDIISYFKAQGKLISSGKAELSTKLVDQFDLLNYEEVRDASRFLTLSKIFYWLSDSVDDKWQQKAKMFESKYGDKISLVNLSLDKNDDGKAENNEVNAIQFVTIVRQ